MNKSLIPLIFVIVLATAMSYATIKHNQIEALRLQKEIVSFWEQESANAKSEAQRLKRENITLDLACQHYKASFEILKEVATKAQDLANESLEDRDRYKIAFEECRKRRNEPL